MPVNTSISHDASPIANNTRNTYDCANVTSPKPEVVEFEAFLYIVVVIAFYATSIVFLLIKYARNDDEEQNLKYNYTEFVKREKFQTAQYKNMEALVRTKAVLENYLFAHNLYTALDSKCPVIIVSEYLDGEIYMKEIDLNKSIDDCHAICDGSIKDDVIKSEKCDLISETNENIQETAKSSDDVISMSSEESLFGEEWKAIEHGGWRSRCQTL